MVRNMKITILTIFPTYFETPLNQSILKRAQESNLVEFSLINIRDFAQDKHKTTDDRPYGGGPGMVMKIEPIYLALKSLGPVGQKGQPRSRIILTSAKGDLFTQQISNQVVQLDELVLICGHYEGVDERVAANLVDQEIRIGDYVLTGGEPAALVIADAVSRLIPGALGNEQSNKDESHSQPGKLGFPQYTRPEDFKGWKVPQVLLSGDHQKICEWKEKNRS